MNVISVPELEDEGAEYPSLGPQVINWIERNLVFGPGDLRGLPAKLDEEKQALIYRFYEIFPQGTKDVNGKLIEGRRRFRRCAVSLQKGSAKTELAAWIAAAELHPEAPVRFDHFDGHGHVWGRGVIDPYIPMVAYTEEQADELAYSALKVIVELSRVADDFDIGLERILRRHGGGKAVALASAPNALDGARTTFAHKDETHRWTLERLRRSHRTMLANLPKRLIADPWELETTTAYSPGENSVAEQTALYAQGVLQGSIKDSRLFYFHRQASDGFDLSDPAQLREAIIDAAGPTAPWRDVEGIAGQWQDPEADRVYLERVYLNRPIALEAQAFNVLKWREGGRPEHQVAEGAKITLGFDGSISDDATALIATELESGFQWPIGIWEKPSTRSGDWMVPKGEVDTAVRATFEAYDVVLMFADPSKWDSWLADWKGEYDSKRVKSWPTTQYRKAATALKAYANAIEAGEVSHNGDRVFEHHIGNAQRNLQIFRDDDGSPLWLIQKDRPGSANKIDAAMAGMLSWMARLEAIAGGALTEEAMPGIYLI
jgi:phage terminase large subunit-like protein